MKGDRGTTTLADVRVGSSAVLLAGSSLDARQARRLVELGLRPGAVVRVMMRTAGGGRVLGVENLRIVVDHYTLGSIPVVLARTSTPTDASTPRPRPVQSRSVRSTPVPSRPVQSTPVPSRPVQSTPVQSRPVHSATPADARTADADARAAPAQRSSEDGDAGQAPGRRRSGTRLGTTGRRLRLLGQAPGLTVLPGEPVGDGTD